VGSARVSSSLACKYMTREEGIDSDKHSSLLQCTNNYGSVKFYRTGLSGLDLVKLFCLV